MFCVFELPPIKFDTMIIPIWKFEWHGLQFFCSCYFGLWLVFFVCVFCSDFIYLFNHRSWKQKQKQKLTIFIWCIPVNREILYVIEHVLLAWSDIDWIQARWFLVFFSASLILFNFILDFIFSSCSPQFFLLIYLIFFCVRFVTCFLCIY